MVCLFRPYWNKNPRVGTSFLKTAIGSAGVCGELVLKPRQADGIETNKKVGFVNLSMDIRNTIHGLEP